MVQHGYNLLGGEMATGQPILVLDFKPPLSTIKRDLLLLGADIRSLHEPLKRSVQQVIIPSIRANFDAGGRPTWPPYAESTIEFHKDLGESISSSMLVKTGALRRVATTLAIWNIGKEDAVLNALPPSVWYGNIHQGGGRSGKGKGGGVIPARPFIMFQDEDGDKIAEVFAKWLDERIARRWAGR
jgi:phage gpG-like protein